MPGGAPTKVMMLDQDGDGVVAVEEMRPFICWRGLSLSAEELQGIFDEVGDVGDGALEYTEFCSIMGETLPPVLGVARALNPDAAVFAPQIAEKDAER